MYLLDTNLIIRFLTNDDEVQSPIAYSLFEMATKGQITLVLAPLVIAECCWVLESKRYAYSKDEIASKLGLLINANGIKPLEKELIQNALFIYSTHNVDFVDAYLRSYVDHSDLHAVITWNVKDFKRFRGEYYTPEQILSGLEN